MVRFQKYTAAHPTGTVSINQTDEAQIVKGTYHSQCADTDPPYSSSKNEHLVINGRSLEDGSNIKDHHNHHECSLSRDSIGKPRHEEAADEGSKLEHTRHKALSKTTFRLGKDLVELSHDVENGDDALVVSEGEASQGSEEGGEEDVGRLNDTLDS